MNRTIIEKATFSISETGSISPELRKAFSQFEFIDVVELAKIDPEAALEIIKIFCDPAKSVYTRPDYFGNDYHGGNSLEENIEIAIKYLESSYLKGENKSLALMIYKDPQSDRYIGSMMAAVYRLSSGDTIIWRETKIIDPDYDDKGKEALRVEEYFGSVPHTLNLSSQFDTIYNRLAKEYCAKWIVTEESRSGVSQSKTAHELRLGLENEGFFAVVYPVTKKRVPYTQPDFDGYDLYVKPINSSKETISREELIDIFITMQTQGWSDEDYSPEQKTACMQEFKSQLGNTEEFLLIAPTKSEDRPA
jgi:hypothetical protein